MSNTASVLPDNTFLLWLQDENEYLPPESLTQMYTHLAPLADDHWTISRKTTVIILSLFL